MSGFLSTGALLEDTGALIASESPIILTPQSATILHLSGEGIVGSDQVLRLPDATKLQPGVRYYVANRSGVAAEIQKASSESFAKIEPGMQAEFRLLDGDTSAGLWDASIFPSVKVGIEDLNLSLLKGGTWSWSEGKLSITADAFIQIPGLPLSVNRIAKFPDVAATEYTLLADVAGSLNNKYVTLKRPGGSGYYFWFNVNGLGSDPGPIASLTGVQVPVATNANLITVLTLSLIHI